MSIPWVYKYTRYRTRTRHSQTLEKRGNELEPGPRKNRKALTLHHDRITGKYSMEKSRGFKTMSTEASGVQKKQHKTLSKTRKIKKLKLNPQTP
jgi:hypothetical protein